MTWHFPATAHGAAWGDKPAVSVDQDTWTWRELLERSLQQRDHWRRELPPNERVILLARRELDFFATFLGLIRAGIPVVLLNDASTTAERAHAQRTTHAHAVIDRAEDLSRRTTSHPPALEGGGDADWAPDRTLVTVMTSGTTGDPKAIDLSCEQVIFSTLGGVSRLGSLPTDRWHAPLPLHHVGGIMVFLRALILGFCAEYTTQFDAAHSAARLQSGDVTLASFVPVMLQRILECAPDFVAPQALRAILLGGAATPDALLEQAVARKLPIARSWGMSETASQIATAPPGQYHSGLAPLPFAHIYAQNDVLHVDGPQASGGYLQTSDRGTIADGRIQILGRADDLFISGGENIDPLEIERVLLQHAGVKEVLVFGVPSVRWGHAVAAYVVADDTVQEPALRTLCKAQLSTYKTPKLFIFSTEIPRNALGKVSRKRAREMVQEQELYQETNVQKSSLGAES